MTTDAGYAAVLFSALRALDVVRAIMQRVGNQRMICGSETSAGIGFERVRMIRDNQLMRAYRGHQVMV